MTTSAPRSNGWRTIRPTRSTGLRMAAALQHHWVMTGRFGEGRAWLERLLALLPAPGDDEPVERGVARAAGLEVAGRLAVLQGQIDVGRPMLEEALAAATAAGDVTWRAHALHGLALASAFWGEPAAALPLLEEALALHREGSDPFGVPLALVQLATVHATLGSPVRAMACADECIALSEAASERWCAALARWVQALVQWQLGHGARARTYARDVLRLKAPFGDRMGMAMSVEVVAWAESDAGHAAEAARLLGAVQSALDSIGASLFGHLLEDHDRCLARTREALGRRRLQTGLRGGVDDAFRRRGRARLGPTYAGSRRRGHGRRRGPADSAGERDRRRWSPRA